jgi:hypothetical protein
VPLRGLLQRLGDRRQISLQDYEQLHEGKKEKSVLPPRSEFALARIDHQGYRHYKYIE